MDRYDFPVAKQPAMREVNAVVPAVWSITLTGLLGFALTSWAMLAGLTAGLDHRLLTLLRHQQDSSDPIGPIWFEEAAAELTALGGYTVLVIVIAVALSALLFSGKRHAAIFMAVAIVGGMLVSSLLKTLFDRPRPDLVEHLDRTFTSSFPSGHATVGTLAWLTMATVAIRFVPRHALRVFLLLAALFLAIAIGVSRVYLGVHWPSDVLAGWCLGVAWSGGCWLVAHHLASLTNKAERFGHSRA